MEQASFDNHAEHHHEALRGRSQGGENEAIGEVGMMENGIKEFQIIRKVVATCYLGLGISLMGWPSVWAQNPPTAKPVQPVAIAKEPTTPTVPADALKGEASDYTISPEDVLDIFVMDVPEVSRTYRVGTNGNLTLPLLSDPVPAVGLTLAQLSRVIASRFHDAGMVSNAQVMVSLKETRLHTVIVSGEVKLPRAYPVFGPTRLLEILTEAGGLTDIAAGDAIITRGEAGARADAVVGGASPGAGVVVKEDSFPLNIRNLMESGDPKTNILLYAGDRVTVKKAELIYILGAVIRPGAYIPRDSQSQLTILRAMALAGDANGIAKKNKLTILRKDPLAPDAVPKTIPVNYKAMVKGQIADISLQPNDILYVPESGRSKFLKATSSTALQIAATAGTVALYQY
jgi:polysaccharide biosynthesis/export protein